MFYIKFVKRVFTPSPTQGIYNSASVADVNCVVDIDQPRSNTGGIVGGIMAAIVVILIAAVIVFLLRYTQLCLFMSNCVTIIPRTQRVHTSVKFNTSSCKHTDSYGVYQ